MRSIFSLLLLGYLLPGSAILRHFGETRDGLDLSSIHIDGDVAGSSTSKLTDVLGVPPNVTLTGSFYLRLPGKCRFDLSSTESTKHISWWWNAEQSQFPTTADQGVNTSVDILCALMSSQFRDDGGGRETLTKVLKRYGVDIRKVKLGRFDGSVAFVLGESSASTLWIEKDHYFPLRFTWVDAQKVSWDLRLSDYHSAASGEWFPRLIEVYKGSELNYKFTGQHADTRTKLDDSVFRAPAT